MQYYKVEVSYLEPYKENVPPEELTQNYDFGTFREEEHCKKHEIAEITDTFNKQLGDGKAAFIARRRCQQNKLTVMLVVSKASELSDLFYSYMHALEFESSQMKEAREVSFDEMYRRLGEAERANLVLDTMEFIERLGLGSLTRMHEFGGLNFREFILETYEYDELVSRAEKNMVDDALVPELKRIYEGVCLSRKTSQTKGIQGHPVHYIIQTDNVNIRKESYRILLSALYEKKRIINKRCSHLDVGPDDEINEHALSVLYKAATGGTVIIRYHAGDTEECEYAGCERGLIESIGEVANKFRHRVLTILCLPRECTSVKEMFSDAMPDIRTVTICEEFVSGKKAEKYLADFCRDYNVSPNKSLYNRLGSDEKYRLPELEHLFTEWYDGKICKDCFPQYREIASAREKTAKQKPKGTAYDELMEMIGLDSAKKTILDALNYFKAQKLFAEKGMKLDHPSMHMVFTGNPGSAKTTVARLFSQILRDNDILSTGAFVEVGRADLVGKYVGHTAPLVKSRFQQAQGGILFIDEAYSLVDDRDGMYGDEAINTIVQEMENHRENVAVIFAGYPDKMEAFLAKNPGLRSRIAFQVSFEDYSTEELLDIADLFASKKGFLLTLGARQKLRGIFDEERENKDFGNGRFVRNILEKARMSQASRLLQMDISNVTKADISTISEEDIFAPAIKTTAEKMKKIGFIS